MRTSPIERTGGPQGADLASPCFFIDAAALRANAVEFQTAFPGASLYYAMKANPHPAIVKTLASVGCGIEAASLREVAVALSQGAPRERVILGSSVKPRSHVEGAHRLGVRHFAADSTEELEMIADAAPGAMVFVRALVDESKSVFQMSSSGKFGAAAEDLADLVTYGASLGLIPWGVSFNVGSQALHASAWADAVRLVRPAIEKLAADGITLAVLNIGGGFPIAYRGLIPPPVTEIARGAYEAIAELPYAPHLMLEPGRGLVSTAVTLLATVESTVARADGPWLYLDAGVYSALCEAMVYQGRTQYPVHLVGSSGDDRLRPYTLAGPTGDGIDVIARQVELPENVSAGHRLLFSNAGAYTSAMASDFNGFPVPQIEVYNEEVVSGATQPGGLERDLPTVATRLVIGFSEDRLDWNYSPANYSDGSLRIAGHPVMQDWERGYMADLAAIAARNGGRVLELGYGLGLSATELQSYDIEYHVVVECHPDVAARCIKDQRVAIVTGRLHLLTGFWQDVVPTLADGSFDGILFDTYPLNEAEIHRNHWAFFPEAFRLLRPGGVLTYYSDEADELGDVHLAQLAMAGFQLSRVSTRRCHVEPPADCEYWQSRTILAPIVVK